MRAALPRADVVTVPGLGGGKRRAQLLSLASRDSYEWGRYRRRGFAEALRREAGQRRPAIVHFDDLGASLAGPVGETLNVFAPHNVEARILAETARSATGARKLFAAAEARKIAREEQRQWRLADLCVAVSDLDAAAMRAGGARRVVVAPNGTDAVDCLPALTRTADEPIRLLFVGTLAYWPNEHGVAWFVREVLPRIQHQVDARFDVVGDAPPRRVEGPGVTYHGHVADLRLQYEAAHAVVVPLHHGSGTRLKVVEAMAYGRPLVSTRLGAEGLPLADGSHFLAADDPETFAARVVALARALEAGEPPHAMVRAARKAAEELFWPKVAARLAEAYRDALAEDRQR